MPKTYDATMKYLLDNYARDWIGWLAPQFGLPAATEVKAVDADLSVVQATADKVFQIQEPEPCCVHVEAQASQDPKMSERMLRYNVLLEDKFNCPVYSVLLLLRPQADARSITGELTRRDDDNNIYLLFRYKCIRVWELPGLQLLHGNLGLVPLAFLTDDANGHEEEWVQAFNERAARESILEQRRQQVLILSSLLAGLRYIQEVILRAFHEVKTMKESTTYQYFFREAREEGREEGRMAGVLEGETKGRLEGETKGRLEGETKGELKGKIGALISILNMRFGQVPPELQVKIQAITNPDTLDATILKAMKIRRLEKLL